VDKDIQQHKNRKTVDFSGQIYKGGHLHLQMATFGTKRRKMLQQKIQFVQQELG